MMRTPSDGTQELPNLNPVSTDTIIATHLDSYIRTSEFPQ
jgi:hypothetical protein